MQFPDVQPFSYNYVLITNTKIIRDRIECKDKIIGFVSYLY